MEHDITRKVPVLVPVLGGIRQFHCDCHCYSGSSCDYSGYYTICGPLQFCKDRFKSLGRCISPMLQKPQSDHCLTTKQNGKVLKLGVPFLGVPIIRTVLFWVYIGIP